MVLFLGLAAVGGLNLTVTALAPCGWVWLNAMLWWVFVAGLVIPHEAAHALCARLLGLHVPRVALGTGLTVCKARVAGISVEFRANPLAGGATYLVFRGVRSLRLRYWLTTVAGPLLHAVLLALLLGALDRRDLLRQAPGVPLSLDVRIGLARGWWHGFVLALTHGPAPGVLLVAANCYLLIVNLIPFWWRRDGGRLPSDGMGLLTIPFMGPTGRQQLAVGALWLEKDFAAVRRCYLDALGCLDPARPKWAEMADCVAHADLLLLGDVSRNGTAGLPAREELLCEADELTRQACAVVPSSVSLQATRGWALVELGQIDRGADQLLDALEQLPERAHKALCASVLAIAEARDGQLELARDYLSMARLLDPECTALPAAEREVTSAASRVAGD
jgi:hypothetical protein